MSDPRWDILNTLHRYALLVDDGEFEAVADLLSDAVLTAEGSTMAISGRDAILSFYLNSTKKYAPSATPRTQHVITNPIVDVDERAGTATCHAYLTVLQAVDGAIGLQPILTARYNDTFAMIDGTWRFVRRHGEMGLAGDLRHHLQDGAFGRSASVHNSHVPPEEG